MTILCIFGILLSLIITAIASAIWGTKLVKCGVVGTIVYVCVAIFLGAMSGGFSGAIVGAGVGILASLFVVWLPVGLVATFIAIWLQRK
jgi:hypothetical protein